MKDKRFIAISTEIVNNRLVYMSSTVGNMYNANGFTTLQLVEFLHGLAVKNKTKDTVFVCYAFSKDNEHIFRDLSKELKDELLQAHNVKKELEQIELAKDDLEAVFYDNQTDLTETEAIEYYNRIAELNLMINEAGKINYNGYKIELSQGKQLTIKRNGVSFVCYDIFGYFRKPLSEAVQRFFGESHALLTENKSSDIEIRKLQSVIDCAYIVKLINHLYIELQKYGISLRNFHGASTITSAILSKAKAKTEFKNFKKRYSLPEVAREAVQSSFYGARTEQFKLGTFDKVNVYDLNSAYAKACTFLPKFLQKPIYSREWLNEKFSCWFIEYDLPKNIRYGILPNRDTSQLVRYKRRGSGWYWQPEIAYLMTNYPECFEIKHGVFVPYEKAEFTDSIVALYELRKILKRANNPLEKVLKLSLATIYGKFCQRVGYAYYYNLGYAGFVTSYVRANLLQASKGYENKTICLLTDAIHTTANLKVPISDELGEFTLKHYGKTIYLGAGIYRLTSETETKQATRGFTQLDFEAAFKQIRENGTFNAVQDYFIGHNLHSLLPVEFAKYLEIETKTVKVAPFQSRVRVYDTTKADLENDSVESRIVDTFSGRASLEYKPSNKDNYEYGFDAVIAGKKK